MSRRSTDQRRMTYGGAAFDPKDAPKRGGIRPWMIAVMLLPGLLVAVVVGLVVVSQKGRAPEPQAVSSPVGSATPSAAPQTPVSEIADGTGPATASPTPRDWPASLPMTAADFVQVFGVSDPQMREAGLRRTCSPGLADQLVLTRSDRIPQVADPVGPPVVQSYLPGQSATVFQKLSGGGLLISLTATPDRAAGWMVTGVEPVNE